MLKAKFPFTGIWECPQKVPRNRNRIKIFGIIPNYNPSVIKHLNVNVSMYFGNTSVLRLNLFNWKFDSRQSNFYFTAHHQLLLIFTTSKINAGRLEPRRPRLKHLSTHPMTLEQENIISFGFRPVECCVQIKTML